MEESNVIFEAWGALVVAHAVAIRRIEGELAGKTPLSLDEYDVLLSVQRAPQGRIRYSALADSTVFTRSGITRIARRMEQKGFLSRLECAEDRRGAFAVLTADGITAMKESWQLYSTSILTLLSPCLDAASATQLKVLLERIISEARAEPLVQIGKPRTS